jgi:hypothetical protein
MNKQTTKRAVAVAVVGAVMLGSVLCVYRKP